MDNTMQDTKVKMQKALDITKQDLATVRTGRATPALIENTIISAYGGTQKMKLMEIAMITASDTKSLLIQPYDPSTKDEIIKGIMDSGSGLAPVSDGDNIRITIPPLSTERRQEYLKLAKAKLEAGKVMIRQIRHEEMTKTKRMFEAKEITEDGKKWNEKKIQEITDEMIGQLDEMGDAKEKELMQI